MKTDDQRKADNLLEDAVQATVKAYDLVPEDAILMDYILLTEARGTEEDDDGDYIEHFGLGYRYGITRSTVALGLMQKCTHIIINAPKVEDE